MTARRPDAHAVLLPVQLTAEDVNDRAVVVFDVLRATSTLIEALAAGFRELWLYASLDAARDARRRSGGGVLLGEQQCLKPADFDFGNSPGQFVGRADLRGVVGHMATTNGTRAVLRAFELGQPRCVVLGSLRNRAAVARHLSSELTAGRAAGVTLVAAGTDGKPALEDVLGVGAVLERLVEPPAAVANWDDVAGICLAAWRGSQSLSGGDPAAWVRVWGSTGARNILAAGLETDLTDALRLDVTEVVGVASRSDEGVVVRPAAPAADA